MPATVVHQPCSSQGCPNPSAFKTKAKPAWCLSCIELILKGGGLESLEPFEGPNKWRLTRCTECHTEAHYKLTYITGKNAIGERTCRVCRWGAGRGYPARAYQGGDAEAMDPNTSTFSVAWTPSLAASYLKAHGFILRSTMLPDGAKNYPVSGSCTSCDKIHANRIEDFSWGCSCARNTQKQGNGRQLLSTSGHAALEWWDHQRNSEKDFHTASLKAQRICHWVCPVCSHSFTAKINDMTSAGPSCGQCSARNAANLKAMRESLAQMTVSQIHELLTSWADESSPDDVRVTWDSGSFDFRCPSGHKCNTSPLRYLEEGCPSCRGNKTREARKGKTTLAAEFPEIAAQWHPNKNGSTTPESILPDSKRSSWWLADCCGYEWEESPRDRNKYLRLRCPRCRTILDSLAWQHPGLASEWSADNPVGPWMVRPNGETRFVPKWTCASDPAHVWEASLSTRSSGAGCPECAVTGKSRIELAYFEVAKSMFQVVRSGFIFRSPEFSSRSNWSVDISAQIGNDILAIEYDGAYWHQGEEKAAVDIRKTTDLLSAGFLVVRLREDDLPPIALKHPRMIQMRVYSSAPTIEETLRTILGWVETMQTVGQQQATSGAHVART